LEEQNKEKAGQNRYFPPSATPQMAAQLEIDKLIKFSGHLAPTFACKC
jgi:hypothetical protein